MAVDIRIGDCRELMRAMESESVDCVVTSPPYWGLRDYGVEGQLGLEASLIEHIETMVDVFAEVHRVLKKEGTLWLNYGDCYATSPNGRSAADTKATGNDDRTFRDKPFSTVGPINRSKDRSVKRWGGGKNSDAELKPKDLCMISNRIAIALQEWGWWVRSEIIWHKPNPMPESVTDRPAVAHEKVWLLSKSQRYFYDADAVAEPTNYPDAVDKQRESFNGKTGDKAFRARREKRNLRNVWSICTAAFPSAHFATFPPALIEPCIKAGCPLGGKVLDPFGGSGTTGMVADRLGRNAILLELNPEYAEIADRRIKKDAGMFADVSST